MHANVRKETFASRTAWLNARRNHIGGSDAYYVVHESFEAYIRVGGGRKNDGDDISNPLGLRLAAGRHMEPFIKRAFQEWTGVKLQGLPAYTAFTNPDMPWAIATPDDLTEDGSLFEAKLVGTWGLGQWCMPVVPRTVYLQVLHNMHVIGLTKAYIAALLGGTQLEVYTIQYDRSAAELLMEIEQAFWKRHILESMPPPVDGSEAAEEYLCRLYAADAVQKYVDVPINRKQEKIYEELRKLLREKKSLSRRISYLTQRLGETIEDNEKVITEWGAIRWVHVKEQERINANLARKLLPREVYKSICNRVGAYRYLSIPSEEEEKEN